jgi:hypothetical protein
VIFTGSYFSEPWICVLRLLIRDIDLSVYAEGRGSGIELGVCLGVRLTGDLKADIGAVVLNRMHRWFWF